MAERFIRALKEQLIWVRTFKTVKQLRQALHDWLESYNERWWIERHRYGSAARVRRKCLALQEAA